MFAFLEIVFLGVRLFYLLLINILSYIILINNTQLSIRICFCVNSLNNKMEYKILKDMLKNILVNIIKIIHT